MSDDDNDNNDSNSNSGQEVHKLTLFDKTQKLLMFSPKKHVFESKFDLSGLRFHSHLERLDLSNVLLPNKENRFTFSRDAWADVLKRLRSVRRCDVLILCHGMLPTPLYSDFLQSHSHRRWLRTVATLRFHNCMSDLIPGDRESALWPMIAACTNLKELDIDSSYLRKPTWNVGSCPSFWSGLQTLKLRGLFDNAEVLPYMAEFLSCKIVFANGKCARWQDLTSANPRDLRPAFRDYNPAVAIEERHLACAIGIEDSSEDDVKLFDGDYLHREFDKADDGFRLLRARSTMETLIAVIDSGVSLRILPEAVRRNINAGRSFVGAELWFDDEFEHGAKVLLIADAITQGKAKFLVAKVLSRKGTGNVTAIAEAIDWAVGQGADVINLSLGTRDEYANIRAAIQRALDSGVIVVACVGNDGSKRVSKNVMFPATIAGVIRVGGVNEYGRLHEPLAWMPMIRI